MRYVGRKFIDSSPLLDKRGQSTAAKVFLGPTLRASLLGTALLLVGAACSPSVTSVESQIKLGGVSTAKAGNCAGPFSVSALDSDGKEVNSTAAAIRITPHSSNDSTRFYTGNDCSTETSQIEIAQGGSKGEFYAKSTKANSHSLSIDDADAQLTGSSLEFVTSPGDAKKITSTKSAPALLVAGQAWVSGQDLGFADAYDNVIAASTVGLDNVTYESFVNSTCATASSISITILGDTAKSASHTKTGTYYVGAKIGGLVLGCLGPTEVIAASPSKFTGPSSLSATAESCSSALTLTLTDAYGNLSSPSGSLALTASISLGGTAGSGTLYSDASCSTVLSAPTVAAASSTLTVYFKSTTAGTHSLVLSQSTLETTTLTVTVDAAPSVTPSPTPSPTPTPTPEPSPSPTPSPDSNASSTQVSISVGGSSWVAGVCQPAITYLLDSSGLTANPSGAMITLSASGAANLYGDIGCTSALTPISLASGTAQSNFYFKDNTAQTITLSAVSSTLTAASRVVTIAPAGASAAVWASAPGSTTIGNCSTVAQFNIQDSLGNSATTSTASLATLTGPSVTFYSDAGCASAALPLTLIPGISAGSVYFKSTTPGTVNLTLAYGTSSSTQGVTFAALAPSTLSLTITSSNPTQAGDCSIATVDTKDTFSNLAGVSSTTVLTVTPDPTAGQFYTDSGCTATTQTLTLGTSSNSKTFYFKSTSAQAVTLMVADASAMPSLSSDSEVLTVSPRSAASLSLSSGSTMVVAGSTWTLTVQALDPYGNTATSYTGTVAFTSNDAQATLPANSTFTGSDLGVKSYSTLALATVTALGSVTGTDTVTGSITGTRTNIGVIPSSMQTISLTRASLDWSAGTAYAVTLTARDAYNNVATGYTGTITWSSSDGAATLPGSSSFAGGDQGVKAFNITLKTSSTQSLTATDSGNSKSAALTGLVVTSSTVSTLVVSGFSNPASAAGSNNFSVVAKDAYSNVVTGYTGTVVFTSSDGAASLPANYAYVNGDAGSHTFSATLNTAGTHTITATDAGNSINGSQVAITLVAGSPTSLTLTGPSSSTEGSCSTAFTATLKDTANNTATASSNLLITLTDGSTGTFYSDSGCANPVTEVTIASSSSAQLFYYKKAAAASVTITISGSGLTSNSRTHTVSAASAANIRLAAGKNHTCAVKNGLVYCWGRNDYGQLGTGIAGENFQEHSPAVVSLPGTATYVAAGTNHSCAVVDGAAYCWGSNAYGLGDGSTTDSPNPIAVSGATSNVSLISAQASMTCALQNGDILCWGYNSGGLGDGSSTNSSVPVTVINTGGSASYIAAGTTSACAVVDGKARCWGDDGYGNIGNGASAASSTPVTVTNASSGVSIVAANAYNGCATVNGAVKCWGYATYGAVGDNQSATDRASAVLTSPSVSLAVDVSVGLLHACAVLSTGGVRCWGDNSEGQIGVNDSGLQLTLRPGTVTSLTNATRITAGEYHTCAATADGKAYCWGRSLYGQLGLGKYYSDGVTKFYAPNQVRLPDAASVLTLVGAPKIQSNQCSLAYTLAHRDSNGYRAYLNTDSVINLSKTGSLGIYSDAGCTQSATALTIRAFSDAVNLWLKNTVNESVAITATGLSSTSLTVQAVTYPPTGRLAMGNALTCFIDDNGRAYCAGRNHKGQLGNGQAFSSNRFKPVQGLENGVTYISAGDTSACAVKNGAAYCWGNNASGQLGDSTNTDRSIPTQVSGLNSGVKAVAVGATSACAVVGDTLKCWGSGSYLSGDVVAGNTNSPSVTMAGVSGISDVSVATYQGCAVSNGGLRCWGTQSYRETGGSSGGAYGSFPVAMQESGSGTTRVHAGIYFTCMIKNSRPQCFGYSGWGNTGEGEIVASRDTPNPIYTGTAEDIASVTPAVQGATCFAGPDGVHCLGGGTNNSSGLGTTSNVTVASPVLSLSGAYETIALGDSTGCAMKADGTISCWGYNAYGEAGDGTSLQRGYGASAFVPQTLNKLKIVGRKKWFAGTNSGPNRCAPAYTVVIQDANDRPTYPSSSSGLIVTLTKTSGAGSTVFYTDSSCTTSGNTVSITSTDSTGVFYATHPATESAVWQATGPGVSAGSITIAFDSTDDYRLIAGASNSSHFCAVVPSTGSVNCWGLNTNMQLGRGAGNTTSSDVPVRGASLPTSGTIRVGVSNTHSCALSTTGVKCWGNNDYGQLGNNTTTSSGTAVSVQGLPNGGSFQDLSVGLYHSCALVNSTPYCWGYNANNQLGHQYGDVNSSNVATMSPILIGKVTDLTADSSSTCFVTEGGLRCQGGSTGYGSIGTQALDGTSPHEVSGASIGTEVVAAQRSEYSQCFTRQDGTSYCFGYGYAGDGSALNAGYMAEPKAVSGITTSAALACGYAHNCAVLSNGAVKCWGYNSYGQLGDNNSGTDSTTPVEPTGLSSGVRAIATTLYSTCALMSGSDAVKCWGYDASGELGANSPGNQAEPYNTSALVP